MKETLDFTTKKNTMNKALSAIAAARVTLKKVGIKRDGRNTYSEYDYFSPEYISKIVDSVCVEHNIICVFNLMQDERGFFGQSIVTELESGDSVAFINRTSVPKITATNETQQYGGMLTYAKRYALMNIFNIEDNSIDPDSSDQTKKEKKTPAASISAETGELPYLDQFGANGELTPNWRKVMKAIGTGKYDVPFIEKGYKLTKGVKTILEAEVFAAAAALSKKGK